MRIESYRGDLPEPVLEQIVDIYIEAFTAPPRFETWSKEEVKAHVRKFLAGDADIFVVVEGDEEVVTFAIGIPMESYFNCVELIEHGADQESYYFAELATRKASRGKGYGAALHKRREQAALERGHGSLSVRVRADNDVNIKLLTRAGFEKVGNYEGTIAGALSEKYILQKKVDQ